MNRTIWIIRQGIHEAASQSSPVVYWAKRSPCYGPTQRVSIPNQRKTLQFHTPHHLRWRCPSLPLPRASCPSIYMALPLPLVQAHLPPPSLFASSLECHEKRNRCFEIRLHGCHQIHQFTAPVTSWWIHPWPSLITGECFNQVLCSPPPTLLLPHVRCSALITVVSSFIFIPLDIWYVQKVIWWYGIYSLPSECVMLLL